jgi:lysophospholipase L1-like esterase
MKRRTLLAAALFAPLAHARTTRKNMITNKVSLYGDSVTANKGYGARLIARAGGKITGVNDYARGGNSFAGNLAGTHPDGPLFNGLNFQRHISSVDDCDIVVLRLGGNSAPGGWVDGDPQAAGGADYLQIAAEALLHVQHAHAAGKRVVLVGTPYVNVASAMNYYGITEGQAVMIAQRMRNVNTALRCLGGFYGVPFIATHGYGGAGGHPTPQASDVPDGVHPEAAYANAVADYLADQIVTTFGL